MFDNFKVFVTEIENYSIRKSSDLVMIEAQNNFHTSMSFMNDTKLFMKQLHLTILI